MSTDKQRSAQMNKSGKKTKRRETRRISILKRTRTQPEKAPEMQKLNPSTCANSRKSQKRHAFLVLYLCLSVLICGSISPLLGQAPAKAPPAREKIDLLVAGGTVVTMDAERRVGKDGAVAVRSDTIVAEGALAVGAAAGVAASGARARGDVARRRPHADESPHPLAVPPRD